MHRDISKEAYQLIVGFFGFFYIIFLVTVIVWVVGIFLGEPKVEEEVEECVVEVDEQGNPIEQLEPAEGEEPCVPGDEDAKGEGDARRLQALDPKLKRHLGDSLNLFSLLEESTDKIEKMRFFKKGSRKKKTQKKKTVTKIYKFNELGSNKKNVKI